ncbi:hypothetical protein HMPREF1531_02142 [Propionibacterium sp. oral taxon 192 str. F0372]|nr:hypothetical protein HMPREF1531_02142 [Propionibacterium sp. oral taxon 192 str. F0372]
MFDSDSLFKPTQYPGNSDEDPQDEKPTLVITMAGYGDAGQAQQLINKRLLEGFTNHRIGSFDVDQLVDYAGSRPPVIFDHDHFRQYEPPEMTLHEVRDSDGRRFVLLSGPEPAYQWERLARTIDKVMNDLGANRAVFLQSMPAPAPHTRPVFVSGYASDPSLLTEVDGIPGAFKMGSTFTAMLSIRLTERGKDVIGLVAHVPHYLSESPYPQAAMALLEKIRPVSGLNLPAGDALMQQSRQIHELTEAQVRDSEDVKAVVTQLEQQYDHWMSERAINPRPAIPSPEEIGAEVEEFLKGLDRDDPGNP